MGHEEFLVAILTRAVANVGSLIGSNMLQNFTTVIAMCLAFSMKIKPFMLQMG